jgi:methylmalonyl-CoA epimerase
MLETIDHLGVATRDLDRAIEALRATGPIALGRRESIPIFDVDAVMVAAGSTTLELIQPTSPESTVARFIEKRGEGLHHVAYRVADIDAAMTEARRLGWRLIDEAPRPGYAGSRVAFIHPKSLLGVLIELVERPRGRDRAPYDPA